MRVLIILREFYCPSKPIGGAERQALKLARLLIEKGVAVTIVTGQWDWGQPFYEKIKDVPVHRHFTGWGMFEIRGVRKFGLYLYLLTLFVYLVKHRNEYDIIHCHSALFGASVVALVGEWLHKRTLVRAMASGRWGDVRRMREERSIKGAQWMLGHMKKADCIVALNNQVTEELVEIGVSLDRIIHIPNGVDVEEIEPKTDYGLGNVINLIFVGRLHPQKGVDVLLLALKKARELLPDRRMHLRLVGDGELRGQLIEMIDAYSLDHAVEFLGQVDNPYIYLSQSDIFVLPSRSEGMSNALLEAMAHGLPCIVTDIPGNNDIVTHGESGLLVQLDDEDDLASAIVALVMNAELREGLGRAAVEVINDKYSSDHVVDRYIALYTDLLARPDGIMDIISEQ